MNPKAKRVICVVKGHDWIVGRVADRVVQQAVPGKKSYHNRQCKRCELEQWNADDAEEEADRLVKMKTRLKGTQKIPGRDVPGDVDVPCDPNEFP